MKEKFSFVNERTGISDVVGYLFNLISDGVCEDEIRKLLSDQLTQHKSDNFLERGNNPLQLAKTIIEKGYLELFHDLSQIKDIEIKTIFQPNNFSQLLGYVARLDKRDIFGELLDKYSHVPLIYPPYYIALKEGNFEMADTFLEDKISSSTTDELKAIYTNYLHMAIKYNDHERFQECLKSKYIIFSQKTEGQNAIDFALNLALEQNNWDMVRDLVYELRSLNPKPTSDKFSLGKALLLSVKCEQYDLADDCIQPFTDLNVCDEKGFTALHYAISHQNNELLDVLLERGALPHRSFKHGALSAMDYARHQKNNSALERIITYHQKHLPKPSKEDMQYELFSFNLEYTAYISDAIKKNDYEKFRLLLSSGRWLPDKLWPYKKKNKARLSYYNMLVLALEQRNWDMIRALVEEINCLNPSLNVSSADLDRELEQAMALSADKGDFKLAKRCILPRPKEHLNAFSRGDISAMHLAIKHNQYDFLESLLQHGADPNCPPESDKKYKSPKEYAQRINDEEALRLIDETTITHEYCIISSDDEDELRKDMRNHITENRYDDFLNLLNKGKIDFMRGNRKGQSPIEVALFYERWEMLDVLVDMISKRRPIPDADDFFLGKVLLYSVKHKEFDLAFRCLEQPFFIEVNEISSENDEYKGFTTVLFAIHHKNNDLLKALLERSDGVILHRRIGETPPAINYAMTLANYDALELISEYDQQHPSENLHDVYTQSLHKAIAENKFEAFQILLQSGYVCLEQKIGDHNAMSLAKHHERLDMLELLEDEVRTLNPKSEISTPKNSLNPLEPVDNRSKDLTTPTFRGLSAEPIDLEDKPRGVGLEHTLFYLGSLREGFDTYEQNGEPSGTIKMGSP